MSTKWLIDTAKEVGGIWETILGFREGYAVCAVIFGFVTMITLAWSGWAVREGQATTQAVSVGAVQAYLRTYSARESARSPRSFFGSAASAITLFLHYTMITPYHPNLLWPIMILFGWVIASLNLPVSALVPDIVDEEELATGGRRREGSFFAMQSFVTTLGGALGLLLVGGFLSLIGFQPGAAQQSEFTIEWIRIFFAWFRGGGYLMAFFILLAYPLTEARVKEIRRALDARLQQPSPRPDRATA